MKKLGLFLSLTLISCFALSHEINRPHVAVVGSAKKQVIPDVMKWSVRVENRGIQLSDVSKQHSSIVEQVLGIAKKHGIKKDKLQATGMSFGENYVYRNNSRVKEGYVASTTIFFELTDFSHYESIWQGLSKVREVSVDWVNYDYSKKNVVRNEVQVAALQDAREKARSMARAMGQELGEVLVIQELSGGDAQHPANRGRLFAESSMVRSDSSAVVSPGSLTIESSVNLISALVSK